MVTTVVRRLAATGAAAVLATVVAIPAHADPSGTEALPDLADRVDAVMTELVTEGGAPGAAVSVVSGDEEVYSRGYGVSDVGTAAPVDPATTGFQPGSTGKLFTAAAVVRLARQGKLDLHADVNTYLPDFRVPDTYPGRPVTLDALLTHTAGFDPDYGLLGGIEVTTDDLTSLHDAVADRMPPRIRPPGTVIAYDNYGSALAGYIVEAVSGQPFPEYLAEHVFGPLDMTGSTVAQPRPEEVTARLATGYHADGVTPAQGDFSSWIPAGPGQVITAGDMGRFMVDQLAESSALGAGVPAAMQEQHYTQHPDMPGLGYIWEERDHSGLRALVKDGDVQGFHSYLLLIPERRFGVFVVVNGDGTDALDLTASVRTLMDAWFPTTAEPPRAVDDGADPARYEGVYLSSRTAQDSIARIRSLTDTPVEVTAGPDGTLTTSGETLARGDADSQVWIPVGNGRFRQVDGPDTIAFDENGVLSSSLGQSQVYLPIAWYRAPALHLTVLLLTTLVLAVASVTVPVAAAVRRLRGRPARPAGPRRAGAAAGLAALPPVAVVVGLFVVMADGSRATELVTVGSPLIIGLMLLAAVAVLAAALTTGLAVVGWFRRWWRLPGRVALTVTALAALGWSAVALGYQLVGPPFV